MDFCHSKKSEKNYIFWKLYKYLFPLTRTDNGYATQQSNGGRGPIHANWGSMQGENICSTYI